MATRAPEDLDLLGLGAVAEMDPELDVEEVVVLRAELKLDPQAEAFLKRQLPLALVRRDDNWFLLLDVASRRTNYVAPGNHNLKGPVKIYIYIKIKLC